MVFPTVPNQWHFRLTPKRQAFWVLKRAKLGNDHVTKRRNISRTGGSLQRSNFCRQSDLTLWWHAQRQVICTKVRDSVAQQKGARLEMTEDMSAMTVGAQIRISP